MARPLTCTYKAADGLVLINTDDEKWFAAACKTLGLQHLVGDERFNQRELRQAPGFDEDGKVTEEMGCNFPALHAEIAACVQKLKARPLVDEIELNGGVALYIG